MKHLYILSITTILIIALMRVGASTNTNTHISSSPNHYIMNKKNKSDNSGKNMGALLILVLIAASFLTNNKKNEVSPSKTKVSSLAGFQEPKSTSERFLDIEMKHLQNKLPDHISPTDLYKEGERYVATFEVILTDTSLFKLVDKSSKRFREVRD